MVEETELDNIQLIELSLTKAPAIKEGFLMKKSDQSADDPQNDPQNDPADGGNNTPTPDPTPQEPEFSFDGLDEDQKQAILTAASILQRDESKLDANTLAFAKSASRVQVKKSDTVTIAKSLLGEDGITEIQAPVRKELEEVSKRVEQLEGERTFEAMREIAKTLPGVDGDEAVNAKATELTVIRKAMTDEQWKSYVEGQQALTAQIAKSALFSQVSGNGSMPVAGDAETAVIAAANDIVQKDATGNTDLGTAIGIVAQRDPQLYRRYMEEQRARSTLRQQAN